MRICAGTIQESPLESLAESLPDEISLWNTDLPIGTVTRQSTTQVGTGISQSNT